jgi:hypothetical protein
VRRKAAAVEHAHGLTAEEMDVALLQSLDQLPGEGGPGIIGLIGRNTFAPQLREVFCMAARITLMTVLISSSSMGVRFSGGPNMRTG